MLSEFGAHESRSHHPNSVNLKMVKEIAHRKRWPMDFRYEDDMRWFSCSDVRAEAQQSHHPHLSEKL